MDMPIRIKRIVGLLAFISAVLVLIHLVLKYLYLEMGHDHVFGLSHFLSLTREGPVPTFFSVLLILGNALLLGVIAYFRTSGKEVLGWHWALLTFIFLLLAMDEGMVLHEGLASSDVFKDASGIFYYAWIIPYMALLLVFLVVFIPFLLHLPPRFRFLFILSGAIYVGGAMDFEMLGGLQHEAHGVRNWTYALIATAEETLEMAGMIVFTYTLLCYLKSEITEIRIKFH